MELGIDKEMSQPRIYVTKEYSKRRRNFVFRKFNEQIMKGKINIKQSYNTNNRILIFRPTQNKLDACIATNHNSEVRVNKWHICLE